jgi:nitrate/TMAO reductase-like tetraheme cytochrome c subunit
VDRACAPAAAAMACLLLLTGTAHAGENDSCVECHANRDFLVTNKKLSDYYELWNASVHKQEGVTCAACHGGNRNASDKAEAHGEGVGLSNPTSGVYYGNVTRTCGGCHEEILHGFETSRHYQQTEKKGKEKLGPTCVTCHGSVDVGVLDVSTVEASCARCHNGQGGNLPENPAKAKRILNRFLSIHRFYRYISIRIQPEEAHDFFTDVDERHRKLGITWHTFDLVQIDKQTDELLAVLKAKRDELREKSKAKE